MKIIRIAVVLVLAGVFGYLAYYLHQRQYNRYNYLSFGLEGAETSVIVPNLDRLRSKIAQSAELDLAISNPELKTGVDALLRQGEAFNAVLGPSCFLSFNSTDFTLAWDNPDLTVADLVDLLNRKFEAGATYDDHHLVVAGQELYADYFNTYLVVSTQQVKPQKELEALRLGNADYVVLASDSIVHRHIYTSGHVYKVWEKENDPVRGRPIDFLPFVVKSPAGFDSLWIYGSQRFSEDKATFFNAPDEEGFSWIDQGMMLIKKDSFIVMLAPQSENRDLKLLLEEQTFTAQNDSGSIDFFNLKSFEIMPFHTTFNWVEAIPELSAELKFYTEYEAYNVLTNSVSAMRWYLSEIQTGNLVGDAYDLVETIQLAVPQKGHQLEIAQLGTASGSLEFETTVWQEKKRSTHAYAALRQKGMPLVDEGPANEAFLVDFAPTSIQPFRQEGENFLLLSNVNQVAVYNTNGQRQWGYKVEGKLAGLPQLIDLENDGKNEVALFGDSRFVVLGANGKVANNLSVNLPEKSKGGIALNYDQKFDYRFFIIQGNTLKCFNEKAQIVTGWQFAGSNVPLLDQIGYKQINGKDYITVKDANGVQFILNRRGENRFQTDPKFVLPDETDFIVGKDEASIHKLGYANQYIYSFFLKGNYRDSVQLDKRVNTVGVRWFDFDSGPILVVDEPEKIVVFNAFGYVEQEILKPQNATKLLGVNNNAGLCYIFFNNSNNSLYLLKSDGKLALSTNENSSQVYGITQTRFYTFDGKKIQEYKLN